MSLLNYNRSLITTVLGEMISIFDDAKQKLNKGSLPEDVNKKISEQLFILKAIKSRVLQKVLSEVVDLGNNLINKHDKENFELYSKAIRLIHNHLNEIVHDFKTHSIALTNIYTKLLNANGKEASPAVAGEMFFPILIEPTDIKELPTQLPADEFRTVLSQYKKQYSESLSVYLQNNDPKHLVEMRQHLVTLEPKNPLFKHRVFFDASIALFDKLIKDNSIPTQYDKWLISRIDIELKRILAGENNLDQDLMSALLYSLALTDYDLVRIKKLKEHLNLDSYVADPNGIDPLILEKFTAVLVKARDIWPTSVESKKFEILKRLVGDIHGKSNFLNNKGFTLLSSNLEAFVSKIDQVRELKKAAIDGASAILILEQQLKEGSNLESAIMAANRLRELYGEAPLENNHNEKFRGNNKVALINKLSSEIIEDLNKTETLLTEYLNGNTELHSEIKNNLNQIKVILSILGSNNKLCQFVDQIVTSLENNHQANIVNYFTEFLKAVELLKTSEESAYTYIMKYFEIKEHSISASNVEKDANIDKPNDYDLLDVFLEESTNILDSLEKEFPELKTHPTDRELMTRIRRYFHTLKGSSRMVGLIHFGDVMWSIESKLNDSINNGAELSSNISNAIDQAMVLISDWVTKLKIDHFVEIDSSIIVDTLNGVVTEPIVNIDVIPEITLQENDTINEEIIANENIDIPLENNINIEVTMDDVDIPVLEETQDIEHALPSIEPLELEEVVVLQKEETQELETPVIENTLPIIEDFEQHDIVVEKDINPVIDDTQTELMNFEFNAESLDKDPVIEEPIVVENIETNKNIDENEMLNFEFNLSEIDIPNDEPEVTTIPETAKIEMPPVNIETPKEELLEPLSIDDLHFDLPDTSEQVISPVASNFDFTLDDNIVDNKVVTRSEPILSVTEHAAPTEHTGLKRKSREIPDSWNTTKKPVRQTKVKQEPPKEMGVLDKIKNFFKRVFKK